MEGVDLEQNPVGNEVKGTEEDEEVQQEARRPLSLDRGRGVQRGLRLGGRIRDQLLRHSKTRSGRSLRSLRPVLHRKSASRVGTNSLSSISRCKATKRGFIQGFSPKSSSTRATSKEDPMGSRAGRRANPTSSLDHGRALEFFEFPRETGFRGHQDRHSGWRFSSIQISPLHHFTLGRITWCQKSSNRHQDS